MIINQGLFYKSKIQLFFLENMLVFLFGYDFLIKILVSYKDLVLLYNYIIVFKVLLVAITVSCLQKVKKRKQLYLPLLGLVSAYVISQLSAINHINTDEVLFNGYYFLSSIVSIIFLIFYYNFEDVEIINKQVKRFLWFIIISSLFIFIGYLFDTSLLKTYFRTNRRFGYQGLLLYHSESGYIYFLALNLMYIYFKKHKNYINGLLLFIIFCSSFLVGTKKTFFLCVIFSIYFIVDNIKKINLKQIGLFSLALIAFFKIYSNTLQKQFSLFYNIYKEDGFWSSFSSYRNVLFEINFIPYLNDLTFVNLFFGSESLNNNRVELELFDTFLFFGVTGIICYILIFKQLYKLKGLVIFYIISSLILAALFSGNLLSSVNVMLLLIVTLKYIKINKYEKKQHSDSNIIL
ncbi:hypothetical protein BFP78_03250 [Gaetbulibacter sp. 5U11]|nr:hypothetical protein BFP78_03250 [Gaetbulibacter sp. 5U11]